MNAKQTILAVVIAALSASAFAIGTDRDSPTSNAAFKPANKWVKAPDTQIHAEEQKFDLDRGGFPQYSPL